MPTQAVQFSNSQAQLLIEKSAQGEKFALAKLISLLEKKNNLETRKEIFYTLKTYPYKNKLTIGLTGTPGAGKSSLLAELCKEFLYKNKTEKIAIVAIDPSSSISGGSILGDRTRFVIPPREERIFFRSQPSQLEMGGLNPYTYHVIRVLRYFFEYVFIETVGIGQNEIEISKIVDHSILVLQPFAGDNIQFMKSGIMEIPDCFVINKCDEKELAASSYHMLLNSLEFLKDILGQNQTPKIFLTSVVKKIGISELLDYILNSPTPRNKNLEMIAQLKRWIKNEFGNWGLNLFTTVLENSQTKDYESLEESFLKVIYQKVS
ncbi:MAG: P-loop NTPase fold protein [Leptospiraceae bacterium]|nr:P-loop NTPase fold protein [Leptospiraceae bacterium]